MNDLFFIIFTAFAVSVDSFFAGCCIGAIKGNRLFPLFVALVTLALSLLTNFLGASLIDQVDNINGFGCVLLGIIGLFLLTSEGSQQPNHSTVVNLALALSVALDGSVASFSLAVMGYTMLAVPFIIALMHLICTGAGYFLASKLPCSISSIGTKLAGSVLIVLALSKYFL